MIFCESEKCVQQGNEKAALSTCEYCKRFLCSTCTDSSTQFSYDNLVAHVCDACDNKHQEKVLTERLAILQKKRVVAEANLADVEYEIEDLQDEHDRLDRKIDKYDKEISTIRKKLKNEPK